MILKIFKLFCKPRAIISLTFISVFLVLFELHKKELLNTTESVLSRYISNLLLYHNSVYDYSVTFSFIDLMKHLVLIRNLIPILIQTKRIKSKIIL